MTESKLTQLIAVMIYNWQFMFNQYCPYSEFAVKYGLHIASNYSKPLKELVTDPEIKKLIYKGDI